MKRPQHEFDEEDVDFEVVKRRRTKGPQPTLSIALPASIVQNAQSPELRMYLAGQVARAAAVHRVEEIVIFRDDDGSDDRAASNAQTFLHTVLEYAETPQYLRKHLFPRTPMLRLAGLLNPLALPNHVSREEYSRWREGVAVANRGGGTGRPTRFVDVGLERLAEVDQTLPAGERVTVDLEASGPEYENAPGKYLYGSIVDYSAPKNSDDLYWGYRVRSVPSLSIVFKTRSLVCNGYDLVLGTSERGAVLSSATTSDDPEAIHIFPKYRHALIVFGGVQGLEYAARNDKGLSEVGIHQEETNDKDNGDDNNNNHQIADLFDYWINTCPDQGSRTIRTEEAMLISLSALSPYLRTHAATEDASKDNSDAE